jgi:hypothetical protein
MVDPVHGVKKCYKYIINNNNLTIEEWKRPKYIAAARKRKQWRLSSRPHHFYKYFFVFLGLFRNRSVCFGSFETSPKHRNKPKKIVFGFAKQTENQPKQTEFRFVSVRTENIFCLFRGHPTLHLSQQRCSSM